MIHSRLYDRAPGNNFARLVFMNCLQCGEVCHCHSEPPPIAPPQWKPDARNVSAPSSSSVLSRDSAAETQLESSDPIEPEASAWRDELSARLNRYRARRKVPPPRYPSLSLPFEAAESRVAPAGPSRLADFRLVSDHALALDGRRQEPFAVAVPNSALPQAPAPQALPQSSSQATASAGAKIIEFPRSAWGPPPPPPDQLAEPVGDRPRILEVPEVAPPAPALGGITIEAPERQEAEKRLGIDIPLQSASLPRRVFASAIDGLIIAIASALFGLIFWKVAAVRPPLVQVLGLAAGIPSLFWAVYQYLLIVYAASTPGLRLAGLELSRFDGTSTSRRLRRWRVVASYLSAASLGMGYAWVFLDEDVLCWHDRITHTYLAPRKRPVKDVRPAAQTSS